MRFSLFLCSLTAVVLSGCTTLQQPSPAPEKQILIETPLQQVIHAQPEILTEQNGIQIKQEFNDAESPTSAKISVLQSGLLDDSVHAIRTEYAFNLKEEKWELDKKQTFYQCARAGANAAFQAQACS